MRNLLSIAIIALLAGCASTNYLAHKEVYVNGKPITYVYAESRDDNGVHMKVIDRFDSDGHFLARDVVGGDGIMTRVIPAAVATGLSAGGSIGAAVLMPGSGVSVTQSGGGAAATAGSSSDSDSSSSATAKAEAKANAKAHQKQAATSSSVSNPTNTNTNTVNAAGRAESRSAKKKCK